MASWTILEIFLAGLSRIWILIYVFIDIFRSHDLSGWAKALWFLFVLLIPLIGVLVYLIARGGKMHEHAVQEAQQQDDAARRYIQQAAGAPNSGRPAGPAGRPARPGASSRPRSSIVRRPRSWPREQAGILA